MPGLAKLLRGVLRYRKELRPQLLTQFETIRDNPEPNAVMFSCMDSRVILTRMLQTEVGSMFLVRNAGNLIPHSNLFGHNCATTEPGALELGCITNGIRHVLVCGHSDCKAMNALYGLRKEPHKEDDTPLVMWLKRHGAATAKKFEQLEAAGGVGPITFQAETPEKTFQAYIDAEDRFCAADKLSQVNTLQQLQNIASYPMLKQKLEDNEVRLNAMWFDVYSGNFFMFSRERERFLEVDESTCEHLENDGESWVSPTPEEQVIKR